MDFFMLVDCLLRSQFLVIQLQKVLRLGILSQEPLPGKPCFLVPFVFGCFALRLAVWRDVKPAGLGLPDNEVSNVQSHVVRSVFKASNSYNFVTFGDLHVSHCISMITHIL